eukprot:SAG31_NODE_373_length_16597_cov_21.519518_8_plen_44_part_00
MRAATGVLVASDLNLVLSSGILSVAYANEQPRGELNFYFEVKC